MSQIQVTGEAKIRDIQGPVVANSGVITALDGDASQYVRGDGTLADFPTSSGGGSSVSYYLNSSVSQGTIGGLPYRQLSRNPISGAGTDITTSTTGYIASYITDVNDPSLLEVPGGNFNCEFYFSVNNNSGNPNIFAEIYKYNTNTSIFTLIGTSQSIPEYLSNGSTLSPYYFAIAVATTALLITDRIAIRIYVNVDGRTVTLHTENNHLCQVITTFSKGLTTLNNLTTQVQFFGTGTSGSDFNIVSSGSTHTFNIPNAGSSNRGLITSGTQTIAGAKSFGDLLTAANLNVGGVLTVFGNLSNGTFAYTLPSANGQLALTSQIPSITGTAYQVVRYNAAGTGIEGGSIIDNGSSTGTPTGQVTINSRLTVNNYAEINRYLSIIQNVDSSWALPSSGTNLEAFITSAAGGTLISDTAYLRPRKASDETFKRFVIQGDDLILNDAVRRTLINKAGPTQSTTKLEVAGYTRFDANINVNGVLQFNATDSVLPTYLQAPSGNVTLMTTGQISLGTSSVSKFVFDVNGALNLGTSDNSNIININNQFTTLNSTLQGVYITPSIVTASNAVIYTGVKSFPQFFLSTVGSNAFVTHFSAINATNTRDTATQIGVYVDNLTSIGTSYGIQSTLSSGSGKYNLYIDGTAINYLKGRLGVDQSNPQYAIDVTGDVNVTGNFKVNGTNLTQGISGGGTQNYIPRYTSATTVGDSKLYQNPATNHVLVNTTTDYSASGGYLQVGGGFTTESFANIIYGSALYVGNTVTLSLVNGNTIQSTGDRTYFIENRVNTGATSANYLLNYWDGGTATNRYTLDHTGLHTFNGPASITGATSIGGTLTGASGTFSGSVGIGTTTGISASLTILSTSPSNQIKVAGVAVGIVYTDSLTAPTYTSVIGLATQSNNFVTGAVAGDFAMVNQTNNALLFATGSTVTEKMRINSVGRLLLGTTADNGSLLQVAGSATFSSSLVAGSLGTPSTGGAGSTSWNFYHDQYAAGDFGLFAASTLRILVNAAGNVGIGTSTITPIGSATNKTLAINAPSGSASLVLLQEGGTTYGYLYGYGGDAGLFTYAAIPLIFGTNTAEKMRITSGGNVLIGTSSIVNSNSGLLQVLGTTTGVAIYGVLPNGANGGAIFQSNSVSSASTSWYHWVGQSGNGSSITTNNIIVYGNGNIQNTNNSYGSLSDISIKENIVDTTNKLTDLLKVRIVNYNLIGDDTKQIGVIAQELEEVFPSMIETGIDGLKGVKYSVFVPMLIKAIQELTKKVNELESKIK